MSITINTLPNVMNYGFRIGTDIEQFERDISGIKSETYGQIAVRVGAFLAKYGNVDIPVVTDACNFIEVRRANGNCDEAAEKLYKSASDFMAIIEANEMVEDLVQVIGWSVQLARLWKQAAFGLRNRGANFARMSERHEFPALQRVVTDWAQFFDETLAPLPDSPFYHGTTVYVSKRTLSDLIERGGQISSDAAGLTNELDSIKAESQFQLSELARAFLKTCQAVGVRVADAARQYLAVYDARATADNRKTLEAAKYTAAQNLFEAAANYGRVFDQDPVIAELTAAAGRTVQIARLLVEARSFSDRAVKFSHMREHEAFAALSSIFEGWLETQASEAVA
jgi:hypothetical protein